MILDKIDELLKEVQTLSAKNAEEVEQLRLKYLSKKGEITALMNDFREVAADQKKTVGMKINELKTLATERINQLREECATQESGDEAIDLTRTPYPAQLGTRHPLTIVTNEIIDIFSRMGFVLADGPEVEDDLHVFSLSVSIPTMSPRISCCAHIPLVFRLASWSRCTPRTASSPLPSALSVRDVYIATRPSPPVLTVSSTR